MSQPIVTDQPEWQGVRRTDAGWGFVLFVNRNTGRILQVAGRVMELRRGDFISGVEVRIYDGDVYLDTLVIDADTYVAYYAKVASEELVRGYLQRQREIDERGPQGQLRMDV